MKLLDFVLDFDDGYTAYSTGHRRDENPFDQTTTPDRFNQWDLGWEEAWLDDK